MLEEKISRRSMLRNTGMAVLGGAFAGLASCVPKNEEKKDTMDALVKKPPFRISLNVSTISGYKLPVSEQIDLCKEAGFGGIELWTRDVELFISQGGTYQDVERRLRNSGLSLENMIGFSSWFADDPRKREDGLLQMRHDMEMTAALGGKFIAAPAQGVSLFDRARSPEYAERYRAILEIGDETGVTPILELWGAGVLSLLSDTMAIALATGHSKASLLLDFYHLYRGGNSFDSLRLVNGKTLPVFHINDYPEVPARTELKDSDRVFPGDGVCPFKSILPLLYDIGFQGSLSVELFNQNYWETMDVKDVLRKSFEKTTQVIDRSFA